MCVCRCTGGTLEFLFSLKITCISGSFSMQGEVMVIFNHSVKMRNFQGVFFVLPGVCAIVSLIARF